jgi:hypothetical protein
MNLHYRIFPAAVCLFAIAIVTLPGCKSVETHAATPAPLNFSGDPGLAGSGQHVDLAADAELRQVDARLDGEAGVGQQRRSSWVSRLSRCAPGPCISWPMLWPVRWVKYSPKPAADHRAGRVVGLEAADGPVGRKGLLDGGWRRRGRCGRSQRPVARAPPARGPPRRSR